MKRIWGPLVALVALVAPMTASSSAVATVAMPQTELAAGPDSGLNAQWNNFGDTNGDWSGGDGTYSTRLPDGQIAWFFSDTLKGTVTQGNLRPPFGTGFVRNSMVVQGTDGTLGGTPVGGSGWSAQTLVTPQNTGSSAEFLWAGDGFVDDDNTTMYRFYMGFRNCGTLFEHVDTVLVEFALHPGRAPTIAAKYRIGPSDTISWGTAVYRAPGSSDVYIYGAKTHDAGSGGACGAQVTPELHVAKVRLGDIQSGAAVSWPAGSAVAGVRPRDEFSVNKVSGKFVLVTQRLGSPADIVSYTFTSPSGAGAIGPRSIYTPPSLPNGQLWYAPRLHPELTKADGTLVVSYNQNTRNRSTDACASQNYFDASIYRPRFVDVSPSAVTSASSAAIPDAGVAASADGRMQLSADIARAHEALGRLRPPGPDEPMLAAASAVDYPVSMIRWTTGACGPVDTPTGFTSRRGLGTTAIITWDYDGPTVFHILPRKTATQPTWPDNDDVQYMFLGAWRVPGVTGVPNVEPIPSTGTPSTVQVIDNLLFEAEFPVQYKLCGQDWLGTMRQCTGPITVGST